MKPPSSSPEHRAQLDDLLRRVIDRINQDPSKAASILTEWLAARPAQKTQSAEHPQTKKKAA